MKNPLRLEDIDDGLLSNEPDLIFVQELQYSNGAVYRGQIKIIPESDRDWLAQSQSQYKNVSMDKQDALVPQHSASQRAYNSVNSSRVENLNIKSTP